MDHVEIERRMDSLKEKLASRGLSDKPATCERSAYGYWCVWLGTSAKFFRDSDPAKCFDAAEAFLATLPRKWTHEETARTLGIEPAQSEAA